MKKITLLLLALSLSFSFFAQENSLLDKKAFWIQSAMNVGKNGGGCWDLAGGPKVAQKGMNIAIWNIDNGNDRLFKLVPSRKFKGFYEIHCFSYDSDKYSLLVRGHPQNSYVKGRRSKAPFF